MAIPLPRIDTSWPCKDELSRVVSWLPHAQSHERSEVGSPVTMECSDSDKYLHLDVSRVDQAISRISLLTSARTIEVSVQYAGEASPSYAESKRGQCESTSASSPKVYYADVDLNGYVGWHLIRLRLLSLQQKGKCEVYRIQLHASEVASGDAAQAKGASGNNSEEVERQSQMSQMKRVLEEAMQPGTSFANSMVGALARGVLQQDSMQAGVPAGSNPEDSTPGRRMESMGAESSPNLNVLASRFITGMSLENQKACGNVFQAMFGDTGTPLAQAPSPVGESSLVSTTTPKPGLSMPTDGSNAGVEKVLERIEARLSVIEARLGSVVESSENHGSCLSSVLDRLDAVEKHLSSSALMERLDVIARLVSG